MANSRNVGNLLVQMRAELGGLKLDVKEIEKTFKSGFEGIASSAKAAGGAIAGALGVGFSVGAVVAFGKSVVATAGQLQDLSDQTGISAQLLSGMKSTLEEAGTSAEAFAKGIFTAQKNLGQIKSDTDPAAIAVKALGLNLDELRNAHPDRFIELIADALGKIDNPVQRAALGGQLLNKTFQQLAPVLGQISGRLAELKAKGMNDADIKRLDEFGDSWTRLGNRLQVIAAGPLSSLIEGFERLFNLSDRARLTNSLVAVGEEIERINKLLASRESLRAKGLGFFAGGDAADDVKQLAARAELLMRQSGIDAQVSKLNAAGNKGKQEPFVPLPGDKKSLSDAETFLNALEKQASQLKQNIVEQTRGADAAKELGIQFELAAVKAKMLAEGKPIPKRLDRDVADLVEQIRALSQELREAKFQTEGFAAATKRGDQDMAEMGQMGEQAARHVHDLAEAWKKVREEFDKMRLGQLAAALDQDSEERGRMPEESAREAIRIAGQVSEVWGNMADGIESAFNQTLSGVLQGTQTWGEAMKNLFGNIGLSIANELQKAFIVNPLMELLLGKKDSGGDRSGGFIQLGIGAISKFFGFAEGGVVPGAIGAPQFAMVHGGETITPPGRGGMSTQVVYNIDARGSQRGVSAEIQRALMATEERAVQRSVGATLETRKRSRNYAKAFR